jgi:hypothetical protein
MEYIDFLSTKPHTFVKEQYRYHTTTGVIFSIITIITVMMVSCYFLIHTFDRSLYTVIQTEGQVFDNYANFSGKSLYFTILDGYGKTLHNMTRYFDLKAQLISNIDGQLIVKNINLEACNHENKKFPLNITSDVMCVDTNDLIIKGIYGNINNNYTYINMYINYCTENCANDEMIKKLHKSGLYAVLLFEDYEINHQDQYNPKTTVYKTEPYFIPYGLFQRYLTYKTFVKYNTDYDYLFTSITTDEFYQHSTFFSSSLSLASTNPYSNGIGQVSIMMNPQSYVVQRNYIKLQTTFANIGGIIKIVMIVLGFFAEYVSNKRMFMYISNNIFDISSSKIIYKPSKPHTITDSKIETNRLRIKWMRLFCIKCTENSRAFEIVENKIKHFLSSENLCKTAVDTIYLMSKNHVVQPFLINNRKPNTIHENNFLNGEKSNASRISSQALEMKMDSNNNKIKHLTVS